MTDEGIIVTFVRLPGGYWEVWVSTSDDVKRAARGGKVARKLAELGAGGDYDLMDFLEGIRTWHLMTRTSSKRTAR